MKLHDFQQANVEAFRALSSPRRLWLLDDMGTGKSVSTVAIMRALDVKRGLIVAPGGTRKGWAQRFEEFWPNSPPVARITQGRSVKNLSKPAAKRLLDAYVSPIQIVSYDLLPEILKGPPNYNFIAFDEFHQVVQWRSQTCQAIAKLLVANPFADVLALSGTPMTAEPVNCYPWLTLMWPGQFKRPGDSGDVPFWFKQRFAEAYPSEYSTSGWSFRGTNAEHEAEFAALISARSRRVLRDQVAHLLPKLDVQLFIADRSDKRADERLVIEYLDTATKESNHVAVITTHHAPLETFAKAAAKYPRFRDTHILHLHESTPISRREALVLAASKRPRSILFATVGQVGTGIDSLTHIKQVLSAEATPSINDVLQLAGRFSRLKENESKAPAVFKILVREGRDDDIMSRFQERHRAAEKLYAANAESRALKAAFEEADAHSFEKSLNAITDSFRGEVDAEDDNDEGDDEL